MSASDLLHAAKSRALKIINTRISREKAVFASSDIPQKSVKQFNVQGVGSIDVPISELNWFKLRDIAHQSSYLNMEEQETNYSWTIDGGKILSQTPPVKCKNWKRLLSNLLTPMVLDLDISKISSKLSRLILCKAGEKYDFKSPAMIKSDHLATLFLQLPMENGNGAGSLIVHLGGRKVELKSNGHSSYSSIAYVFYPECQCELKPVSTNHRLILEFDLLRSTLPSSIELKAFKNDGKLVQEALSGLFFQSTEIRPDALLIGLDHQYNQRNLALTGLKGGDAVVAKLFQSISDFHVHLTLFTDDPDQPTARLGVSFNSFSNLKRRAFQIVSGYKNVKCFNCWIFFDTSPIKFEFLCSAETESNLVIPQGITQRQTESAKEPQFDKNALFSSALVVWPTENLKKIKKKLQPLEHWNLLRKLAGLLPLTVTGSRSEMSSIANYIRNNMECLTEDKIVLAFQTICLQSQFHDISLDVLQSAAEYTKWPNPSVPCGLIAEAVDIAEKFRPPWNQVPDLFHRLSNVDLWAKIGFCSTLAETMNGRQISCSFSSLAQLTHDLFLLATNDENLPRIRCPPFLALSMFCRMMMRLEKMKANSITQPFVEHLRLHFNALSIDDLLRLVVQIPSDLLNLLLESDPCRNLYLAVWYLLRVRDYSCESFLVMSKSSVVQSVLGLLRLKEPELVVWFISKMALLLSNNGQSEFLQTIFSSAELIFMFNSTEYGKRALKVLRSVQIIDLYRRQQPVFTWQQSDAVVDGHPEVQNFLRSAEQSHCYKNFKSLAEARAFAEILEKNQSKADAKYSVTATPGGRGEGSFCMIVKTRGRFENSPDDKTTETTKELKNTLNNGRRALVAAVEENDSCPAKRLKLEQSDEQGTANPVPTSCSKKDKSVAVSKMVKFPEQPQKEKITDPPQGSNIQGEMNKWFRLHDETNPAASVAVRHLLQELINDNVSFTEYVRKLAELGQTEVPCYHLLEKHLPKLRESLRLGSVNIIGINPPVSGRTPDADDAAKPTSAAITSVKSEMKVEVSNQTNTSEKIDVSQTNEVIFEAIVKKVPLFIDLT